MTVIKLFLKNEFRKLQLPFESKRPSFYYDTQILLVRNRLTDSTLANQLSPEWMECGPLPA